MIEVKNLSKIFNIKKTKFKAIDNVSFNVNDGEIFGIIGLSGAGKSTLVRCINRLEEPDEGEILIDNEDILKLNKTQLLKKRKEIGIIFQHFNLFIQKSVAANIAYPLEILNLPKTKIKERVDELLDFIDLKDKKNAYPSSLSGGQKQRVAIARAIATNPKILLSDEGTSALDPANTQSILNLLKKIVKKYNTTIIMITHQMEVAKDICDRIAVMDKGKIIEENTTDELFKHPKHKLTRSFIQDLQDKVEEEIINTDEFKGDIVRLSYDETNYGKPVLSHCMKNYDIDINILSGNINRINDSGVGYLIIELQGNPIERTKAIEYLKNNNVSIEVL